MTNKQLYESVYLLESLLVLFTHSFYLCVFFGRLVLLFGSVLFSSILFRFLFLFFFLVVFRCTSRWMIRKSNVAETVMYVKSTEDNILLCHLNALLFMLCFNKVFAKCFLFRFNPTIIFIHYANVYLSSNFRYMVCFSRKTFSIPYARGYLFPKSVKFSKLFLADCANLNRYPCPWFVCYFL